MPILIPPPTASLFLEEGLYRLLSTNAGVIAAVSTRIYPNRLPQPPEMEDDRTVRTALVYTRTGGGIDYAYRQPIDTKMARFWIDIYGATHQIVRQCRDAVEALLSGYRATIPGTDLQVQGIFFESMREFFEPEPEYEQYRSNIEITIHYLET